jgi:hypothetical protein
LTPSFPFQLYYASNIVFTLALGLSKMSVVFFLSRLTVVKAQKLVFLALTTFIATWTVGSTFAVALQCDLHHPWIIVDEKCPGAVSVTPGFGAISVVLNGELIFPLRVIVPAVESHRRIRHHLRAGNRPHGHLPRLGPVYHLYEESDSSVRIWVPSRVSESILSRRIR